MCSCPVARAAGWQTERLGADLASLDARRTSLRAAIDVWEVEPVYDQLGSADRARIDEAYRRLGSDTRVPLAVRRLAMRLLAAHAFLCGRSDEAEELAAGLGWLRAWWIIGPFDDQDRQGFDLAYPPERELDLAAVHRSKERELRWRPIRSSLPDGRIPVHPLVHPETKVVVYAQSAVELPSDARVLLSAGCDDGCKIWLDGRLLLADPGSHGLEADQFLLAMRLRAGVHRILVKVVQDEGAAGFQIGLVGDRGQPLEGLRVLGREEIARAAPGPALEKDPERVESLADGFLRLAEEKPGDPLALAEAARALYFTSARDERGERIESMLRKAISLAPEDSPELGARLRRWLARASEDENLSRSALEQAVQLQPGDPRHLAELAALHHVRGQLNLALHLHRRALKTAPRFGPSALEICGLLSAVGLDGQAESCAREQVGACPDCPEVLAASAKLFRQAGRLARARELVDRLTTMQPMHELGLRMQHELALQRGELAAALTWLERLARTDPWRIDWLIERGDLLLANGRGEEAIRAYRQALAVCPDHPRSAVKLGLALLDAGHRAEALDSLSRALALAPQDRELERRVQELQSRQEQFFDPYRADARQLAGSTPAAKRGQAGAERLLELTVVRLHRNGMASRFRQQIVRILDERGAQRLRSFRVEYVPGRQEVRVIESSRVRPDGSLDRGVLVDDYSLSEPWYNLYYDVHAREVTFPGLGPGDVVELTTRIDDVGGSALLPGYFGDLIPFQFEEPVRELRYVLIAPESLPLAFHSPARARHERRQGETGAEIHEWIAERVPGVEVEVAMPGFTESFDYLHLSTRRDWRDLSRWFYGQIQDQLVPDDEVRARAAGLVEGIQDPLERIRAVFRFVADNTRYVGLEFGIHSYIPYRCGQVLRRRFGDCKDKSALLVALFASLGIPARLALVRMHRLGAIPDEPASLSVFNHAICYLPEQGLWLDGTATLHDLGDLPPQDQGTEALVIGAEGGRLVKTPTTGPERNRTRFDFRIKPSRGGPARVEAQLHTTGMLAPELRIRYLVSQPPEKAFGRVIREILPGAQVQAVELHKLREPEHPLEASARLLVPGLVRAREDVFELPALGRHTAYQRSLAAFETRRHDLLLGPAWSVHWHVEHEPVPGSRLEAEPRAGELSSPFGTARLEIRPDGRQRIVDAELVLSACRVPAAAYPEFRAFLSRADQLFGQTLRYRDAGAGAGRGASGNAGHADLAGSREAAR